jgi:SM-20-related protein
MNKYDLRQWTAAAGPSPADVAVLARDYAAPPLAVTPPPATKQRAARNRAAASPQPAPPLTIRRRDDLLTPDEQKQVYEFLNQPGWQFGWKSHSKKDVYSFWHKHFAGTKDPDHEREDRSAPSYTKDCTAELKANVPLIYTFWDSLHRTFLAGHKLVRCYANAFSYGCDGTVHTDSTAANSFTTIYYPNPKWNADWGGETMFFNPDKTDILGAVYPKPNRLITFPGALPHAARGIARSCPLTRITLMFKTEFENDRPPA